VPTAPTCSVGGSLTLPSTDGLHYTWSDDKASDAVGDHTLTATADEGYVFADGAVAHTFTVTVLGATNDCPAPLVSPTVTEPVCTGPGTSSDGVVTLPASTETVTYSVKGDVVTATTQAPYRFTATPGWVVAEDGLTATYTVTFTSPGDCLVDATPVPPTVTPSTVCGVEGSFTIPSTPGVQYLLDDEPISAGTYAGPRTGTVTAEAEQGYRLTDSEWWYDLNLAAAEACPVITVVAPVAPTVTPSTTCATEGSYTVPSTTGVEYLLDGKVLAAGTYPGPATGTVTARAAEGYRLSDSEWSFALKLAPAEACPAAVIPPATPVAPAVTPSATPVAPAVTPSATCGVAGTYTIPATAGVTYLLDGTIVAAGTHQGPASGTITAAAVEGYQLTTTGWTYALDVPAATACAAVVTQLPKTGSSVPQLAASGAIGLLIGFALLALGARRREDGEQA
jgi:serine protease